MHVYRRGVQYLALQAFGVARRRLLLAVLLGYALVELSLHQPASQGNAEKHEEPARLLAMKRTSTDSSTNMAERRNH